MANPFIHVELNTTNLGRAKDFYAHLFGWQLNDMKIPGAPLPDESYTIIDPGKTTLSPAGSRSDAKAPSDGVGVGGGMLKHPEPGEPSTWLAYVLVDDVPASVKKARDLGAEVVQDCTEIPGMGWLGLIKDPTGAKLGLWKPKPM